MRTNTPLKKTRDQEAKVVRSRTRTWAIILGTLAILSGCYYLGNHYQKITLIITPEKVPFDSNNQAPAYEVASINMENQPALTTIPIVPVNFEYTAKRAIENLPTEYVSTKSRGVISITNTNPTTQLFTEGTKFINPTTKKLYALVGEKIVLPSGTPAAPSKTLATIEALEPGQEYNLKKDTTLQVNAWYERNDPRISLQYAIVQENGIAGGFVGDKPLMNDAAEDKIVEELKKELQFVLQEKAYSLSLTGAFKIDNKSSLAYDEPNINTLLKTPEISLRGTYQIYLMKKNDWYSYVYNQSTLPIETVRNVMVRQLEKSLPEFILTFDGSQPYIVQQSETVFVRKPDEQAIVAAINGQPIARIRSLLSAKNFPIESVRVQLQPFWLTNVPDNAEDIRIVIDNTLH
ncbi:MAG TPA: hypothetical protein VGE63_02055 [Candidatus Paceibacterota bacterium]